MRARLRLWDDPGVRAWLSSLSPSRRVIGGAAALLLVTGAMVVVMQYDGGWPEDVRSAGADSSTTTEAPTTTSTTTTSTTEPPTTSTTTSTTLPATPTPPPATTPPATTPPAPPPGPASLDMASALAFAKAGSGGTAPRTYTGARVCPEDRPRHADAGDDSSRDITDGSLNRFCDGVYRGVMTTTSDQPELQAAWIRIDSTGGGCQGVDHVVIGWHLPNGAGGGAVIATPGCDQASWGWVEPAGFPVYSGAFLQLDFRESAIGSPTSFYWRGYVQAVGETGAAIDVVPNSGPEHFVL